MEVKIRPKNKKVGKVIVFLVGLLLSTFFSTMTWKLFKGQLDFKAKSYESEGTVVAFSESKNSDNKTMYSPTVEYTDRENKTLTFTSRLASSGHSYDIGEKVSVLIPEDGDVPQINSFVESWFGPLIMSVFALVTSGLMIFSIIAFVVNRRRHEELSRNGQVVKAKISSVTESAYYKNETLSWIIKAQWQNPVNNKVYVFESEEMNYNPKDFLGETIDVTILPKNPKIYEMDMSGVPEMAN